MSQFSLTVRRKALSATKIFCILFAGLTGGFVGRLWAMAMPMKDGGVPVTLSLFGEVLFFVVGALAGIAAATVVAARLRREVSNLWRSTASVAACALSSCIAAPLLISALCGMFITIPHEVFDLLTDPPVQVPRTQN
jgi:hypothetical protein